MVLELLLSILAMPLMVLHLPLARDPGVSFVFKSFSMVFMFFPYVSEFLKEFTVWVSESVFFLTVSLDNGVTVQVLDDCQWIRRFPHADAEARQQARYLLARHPCALAH